MNISGILFSGANGVYSTKLVTGNNTLDRENPDILRDVGLYQFNLEVRNTSILRGTVLMGFPLPCEAWCSDVIASCNDSVYRYFTIISPWNSAKCFFLAGCYRETMLPKRLTELLVVFMFLEVSYFAWHEQLSIIGDYQRRRTHHTSCKLPCNWNSIWHVLRIFYRLPRPHTPPPPVPSPLPKTTEWPLAEQSPHFEPQRASWANMPWATLSYFCISLLSRNIVDDGPCQARNINSRVGKQAVLCRCGWTSE